ncbi:MAG: phage integrase N-terminal SAM-like domain-containing protein, partial [Rhodospirillales bacterium]|nr:phage integrase N-terminal SAM-like domain-containing protein [Rhodospirillales bacterium]
MRGLWVSKPNPCRQGPPIAELSPLSKFSRHFDRSPDRLGLEEVRAFQVHLVSSGLSWPALKQTVCALRFFYGMTLGHGEIPERIPYARAAEVAGRAECRRGGAVSRGGAEPEDAGSADDGRRRRATGLGGGSAQGCRYRQRPHGDPGRARQGWQGPHRHAVGAAAGDSANILASRSAAALAVPWSGEGEADRRAGAPCGVSFGLQGGGPRQAGDGAHAEAQLRHPPPGERHRHSHHPGAAGSCQPVEHGA